MKEQRQRSQNKKAETNMRLNGRIMNIVGYASLGVLGMLGIAMTTPSVDRIEAFENTSEVAATRILVDATAMVSVSLGGQVEMEIMPENGGQFAVSQTDLNIMTNNPEGFSVYMNTVNGKGSLSQIGGSGEAEIQSIESATQGQDFSGNTWGYSLAESDITKEDIFHPVPPNTDRPIEVTIGSVGEQKKYKLGFGAHIDASLPAGKYSNMVLVSVVANPQTIKSLDDLVYMQDMTPEICAATPSAYDDKTKAADKNSPYYLNPVSKKVYDARDKKKYYVAKLADGNCWMTQNLDYDLVAGDVLTMANTDVTVDWTMPNSTETTIPTATGEDTHVAVRSWDLGEIVLKNPTESIYCGGESYDSVLAGGSLTEGDCAKYYQSVAGMEEGAVATQTSSVDGDKYDGHYLIGNYYSWNAATAGTGVKTDAKNQTTAGLENQDNLTEATSSICPKGWRLPTSGGYDQTIDGVRHAWPYAKNDSFYSLLFSYGYPITGTNGDKVNSWAINNGLAYTVISGDRRTRIDYAPFYAVRSGRVQSFRGVLRFAGSDAYLWSSVPYPGSSESAYYMVVDTGNVGPAYELERDDGLNIRCIAR